MHELELAVARRIHAVWIATLILGGSLQLSGQKAKCLDFFAGCGLATEGLRTNFDVVWANDNCPKKRETYVRNHPDHPFASESIQEISGLGLPPVSLSWASFPCQDLSLAGKLGGIDAARSGLVWHWLRIMDEMAKRPPVVVAENVQGLLTASGGSHYRLLHEALTRPERGYKVGAVVLDALYWVPQSRPRVFVIGVRGDVDIAGLTGDPDWCHPASVLKAAEGVRDFVWWKLPKPPVRKKGLSDLVDLSEPLDDPDKAAHNLGLIPPKHLDRLQSQVRNGQSVFPGYKRIRQGQQFLELRFDDVAGCLRTPGGGSSRQHLVVKNGRGLGTRLLTVREAARLMGVRESYKLPESYNDGYKAMGDAVAVPAVRHLARHLLSILVERAVNQVRQND
jgi:DNA (cytosine-5)-methyltransferase 1